MAKYLKNKVQRFQKGRIKGIEHKNIFLKKGKLGLKALENGRITSKQIEIIKRLLKRRLKYMKKRIKRKFYGKLWLNLICNYPLTKKPLQVRMGKGKGPLQKYVSRVKSGRILLEITGNLYNIVLIKILQKLMYKFPIKTKIVYLNNV